MARHLGVLWIATEAVTLCSVPLLHFNNTPRAFEATWKYLLVGGTGIALSLLGSFCLGYASLHGGGAGDLTFTALMAQGAGLSRPWVLIAWVLLLVGYGTKMGLAPMHTWKPDAYGEAPGIVGAMLAGGVTTVAFTAVLRVRAVVDAAGAGVVASRTLLVIGLFSTLVAALFLLSARDFKRMLAYSSVEHMGILSFGAALGGVGLWAAFFHVWNNSMTKGALFLSAGNIRRAAGGRTIDEVSGMSVITPRSAALFVAGLFAVTACPPFGPFFSELLIVKSAFADRARVGGGFLSGLSAAGVFRPDPRRVCHRLWPAAQCGARDGPAVPGNLRRDCASGGVAAAVAVAGPGHAGSAARIVDGGGQPAFSEAMNRTTPFALLTNGNALAVGQRAGVAVA